MLNVIIVYSFQNLPVSFVCSNVRMDTTVCQWHPRVLSVQLVNTALTAPIMSPQLTALPENTVHAESLLAQHVNQVRSS